MMKEIGGYLELEKCADREYYPDLHHLNLGRTALLALAHMRGYRRLYLPYFLCDSVIEACKKDGLDLVFYHIDADFLPRLSVQAQGSEAIYIVNAYGQLSDVHLLALRQKYSHIIVDNTHSFYQSPLAGIDTLYSCRKYFGLPDGAYLSCDIDLSIPDQDHSEDRFSHILGRVEDGASAHYHEMLDTAALYHDAPILRMSALTRRLLGQIDYEAAKAQRNKNYALLQKRLGGKNRRTFSMTDGPFCYPFLSVDGGLFRQALSNEKIYVPTYWNNVIKSTAEGSIESDYASNILPLPCDQRYGSEEMNRVADILLTLL